MPLARICRTAVCIWMAGLLLFAQKAQPIRIAFPRNSSSGTINGSLKSRQQLEYVLGAKAGQTISYRVLRRTGASVEVQIVDPQGSQIALRKTGALTGSAGLPTTGDYSILVRRAASAAGSSSFRLRITIH